MDEMVRLIENPDPFLSISDNLRERCIEIAKESINNYCNGKSDVLYHSAIKLMINGKFDILKGNLVISENGTLIPASLNFSKIRLKKSDVSLSELINMKENVQVI